MTKPAICVQAAMDIKYVASFMLKVGITLAPVEENGEYIGMVSLSDLVLDNVLF